MGWCMTPAPIPDTAHHRLDGTALRSIDLSDEEAMAAVLWTSRLFNEEMQPGANDFMASEFQTVLGWVEDGRLVGCIDLRYDLDGTWLEWMWLHPRRRNRGWGRRAMRWLATDRRPLYMRLPLSAAMKAVLRSLESDLLPENVSVGDIA